MPEDHILPLLRLCGVVLQLRQPRVSIARHRPVRREERVRGHLCPADYDGRQQGVQREHELHVRRVVAAREVVELRLK